MIEVFGWAMVIVVGFVTLVWFGLDIYLICTAIKERITEDDEM